MHPWSENSQSLAFAIAAAALPALVSGAPKQKDYPACAVNVKDENGNPATRYYCCEFAKDEKFVYTLYKRPSGEEFGKYYEEGWKKPRQINYPFSEYTPDSPEFVYTDKSRFCQLKSRVLIEEGAYASLEHEMQCNFDAEDSTLNKTLYTEEQSSEWFMVNSLNLRNNNATFPPNAKCVSLMLEDGQVNQTALDACSVSRQIKDQWRFDNFDEGPLVAVYVVYFVCWVMLGLWVMYRNSKQAGVSTASKSKDANVLEEGHAKLMQNRGGPDTPGTQSHRPSMATRTTEVNLRHSVEDVVQMGYSDCGLGKIVFGYFILMTLFLNVLQVLLVLDYTQYLQPALFDRSSISIRVFLVVWCITAVWFSFVVIHRERLLNYFRLPSSLESCTRVRMFKPENTEIMLHDRSGVSQLIERMESMFGKKGASGYEETVDVHVTQDGARFVEFQHLRYTFDEVEGRFVPGSVELGNRFDHILAEADGLSTVEHCRRMDTVGRNAIEVEMPTITRSLVDEFFSFFYVYQLLCYYVWFYADYMYVAALNSVVILGSAIVNIVNKRQMMWSIVQMTRYETDVTVKRDGSWVTVKSSDIVPGDLVRVAENWQIPCDLVIVKGSTVCDESMLTGESMPVQKFPVPSDSRATYEPEGSGKKYTLFAGTQSLSSGRNEEILAVVQSTGAHTSRGQLVQSILFPVPMRFKYDEHLKALLVLLFLLGLGAAFTAIYLLLTNDGLSNRLFAFVYGMFMFSAVLNPLLPVVLTVGQVNASKRLETKGVCSLNPQRITLCGKVRVFCFDKTGTITKQGLDYRGCVPVNTTNGVVFDKELNDMTSSALNSTMRYALASCHAVGSLNGELVGSEVEVKMFKSTQWKLIEREGRQPVVQSPDGSDELEVVKRFEFDHHRMSMSVVMRHTRTGELYVFCKGSYEKMFSVSNSESVPEDYMRMAEQLAKNGCYVLGMSFKRVSHLEGDALQSFIASRDTVEADLSLLGLIMFRNELKDDSKDAIVTLKKGDIRPVMITGDNAMTGCYIARASTMVDEGSQVILGDMVYTETSGSQLVWKDVDTERVYTSAEVREMVKDLHTRVELAVTGKAFDQLVKTGDIHDLLMKIRIFSRMTPNGKVECVKLHMSAGAVTGMCGDGGNDCGALRIAHVGVALSDAEASVVSPFTSRTKSLQSVVDLVLEGRGALATSFGSVKYLIIYGFVGVFLRVVQYSNGIFICEMSYIFSDGLVVVGLSYAITRARPLKKMGTQRPTSSLVGPTTISSLLGQCLLNAFFMFYGVHYLMSQPWFCPLDPKNGNLGDWRLFQDNTLSSGLWILVVAQQMVAAITCSLGSSFRRSVYRNAFLVAYSIFLHACVAILFLGPPNAVTDIFRVASSTNVVGLPDIPFPDSFRWELFGIAMLNSLTNFCYEFFIVLGPVRNYLRNKYHKDLLPMKL